MSDDKSLSIPVNVNIPPDILTEVMQKAVEAKAAEMHSEFMSALSTKETQLQALLRGMDDRIQAERNRIDTKVNEIDGKAKDADKALEALKGKVNTRVNTFVVPGVIVTFVVVALAVWTAVGGWSVIDKVKTLKNEVGTASTDYTTAAKDLATTTKEIEDLKLAVSNAQTAAGQAATIIELQRRLAVLEAALAAKNKGTTPASQDQKGAHKGF